jgi:uncharacterized DUF497 family protein
LAANWKHPPICCISNPIVSGFIWTRKNVEHIAEHGIEPHEAEHVVVNARSPYPQVWGDGKWIVRGQTVAGRFIQVIFVLESDAADIDYEEIDLLELDQSADSIYVIHARPLTDAERSALKRARKKR